MTEALIGGFFAIVGMIVGSILYYLFPPYSKSGGGCGMVRSSEVARIKAEIEEENKHE